MLVGKLCFVVAFEHLVLLVQALIQYLIPDVPEHVTLRQQRETFLHRQAFMKRQAAVEQEQMQQLIAEDSPSEDDCPAECFLDSLPAHVSANQIADASRSDNDARRHRRRPFFMMLFRRLLFC